MINLFLIGQPINWLGFAFAVAIMVGVALLLGVCILLISKACKVKEDPRIKEVESCLAGANCGACGCAGCADFAKNLVEGKADLSACSVTSAANKAEISNILGIATNGDSVPTVAVVACCGGNDCSDKCSYQGYGDCISQNMLAGGRKACDVGCMGSGSCVTACPYDAIKIVDGKAVVDAKLCKSCGLCIKTCPKKLIKRVPETALVYVACSSQCRGKEVMNACKAGCIACGKCQRECPSGAIILVNNVPVIDYSKCTNCGKCAQSCPRKCIKYLNGAPKASDVE